MSSEALRILPQSPTVVAKKPAVDPRSLTYKDLESGPFWQ